MNPIRLGLEDGRVQDSQMTASSHQGTNLEAPSGRLNSPAISGRYGGGWRAGRDDPNPWIMVDFLRPVTVTGIITQGRDARDQWVTQYDLAYSDDSITWIEDPMVCGKNFTCM